MRQGFSSTDQKEKVVQNQAQEVSEKEILDISDLWKKENYWAIWLGFAMLFSGLLIDALNAPVQLKERVRTASSVLSSEFQSAPFKTIFWYKALDEKKEFKTTGSSIGITIQTFTSKPRRWSRHLRDVFIHDPLKNTNAYKKLRAAYDEAENKAVFALISAKAYENRALINNFSDERLNRKAVDAIHIWRVAEKKAAHLKKELSSNLTTSYRPLWE